MKKKNDSRMDKKIKEFANELKYNEMEDATIEQNKNESFVFYVSFYESIEFMPKRIQHQALKILIRYALYGEEPDKKTTGRIMQSFVSWRKQIDANQRKRRKCRNDDE